MAEKTMKLTEDESKLSRMIAVITDQCPITDIACDEFKELLKNQSNANYYKELSNGLQLACDELREKAEKWDKFGSTIYEGLMSQYTFDYVDENQKIVERLKKEKAELELLVNLNAKLEDTNKLSSMGIAAVLDTISILQKILEGTND